MIHRLIKLILDTNLIKNKIKILKMGYLNLKSMGSFSLLDKAKNTLMTGWKLFFPFQKVLINQSGLIKNIINLERAMTYQLKLI